MLKKFPAWVLWVFLAGLVDGAERPIQVRVEVDFGPVGKSPIVKTLTVSEGSTALDATRAAVALKQGFVCCDPEDVEKIEGVACDPEVEGWWLYEVNGMKGQVSAHRMKLQQGDRVRWYYTIQGSLKERPVAPYAAAPRRAAGRITGEIKVEGDLPALPPFAVHKNHEACGDAAKPHPCSPFFAEGRVRRAVAWIEEMPAGRAWPKAVSAILDQKRCEFSPHLMVLPVGTELEIKNSDGVLHTVHAYDRAYKTYFHAQMKGQRSRHLMTLDQPGVWDLQCDAGHRWMKAHVIVLQNPYVAYADERGGFELDEVPRGTYRVNVWHDGFGMASRPVEVKESQTAQVAVVWTPDDFRIDRRYAQEAVDAR